LRVGDECATMCRDGIVVATTPVKSTREQVVRTLTKAEGREVGGVRSQKERQRELWSKSRENDAKHHCDLSTALVRNRTRKRIP